MSNFKPVERLFPFAIRARIIVPGGDSVVRLARKLEFALLATDLSPKSRNEIEYNLRQVPFFVLYSSAELERFFAVPGAKVLGFKKSDLARSIARELKQLPGLEEPADSPTPTGG